MPSTVGAFLCAFVPAAVVIVAAYTPCWIGTTCEWGLFYIGPVGGRTFFFQTYFVATFALMQIAMPCATIATILAVVGGRKRSARVLKSSAALSIVAGSVVLIAAAVFTALVYYGELIRIGRSKAKMMDDINSQLGASAALAFVGGVGEVVGGAFNLVAAWTLAGREQEPITRSDKSQNCVSMKVAGAVLSTIAIVFTIVAALTPGWIVNVYGLFYVCGDGICTTYPAGSIGIVSIVTLVFMVLAVVLMLPGVILAFIGCKSNARHLKSAGALSITGGILSILGVASFTGFLAAGFAIATQGNAVVSGLLVYVFGYSYWLAWIGGVSAIVGGALNVLASKSENAQEEAIARSIRTVRRASNGVA